jgi:hypothetical protein
VTDASNTTSPRPYQQAFMRIHAEFAEMPGMRLSLAQVQRLAGIEGSVCQSVLVDLVRSGFLAVSADGSYVRASEPSTTGARQDRRLAPGRAG